MKYNILVTGAFGLLGKPLVLNLINLNNNVFILEKRNTKRIKFLSKKPKKRMNIGDSSWVHFMYLDNIQFIDKFGNLIINIFNG